MIEMANIAKCEFVMREDMCDEDKDDEDENVCDLVQNVTLRKLWSRSAKEGGRRFHERADFFHSLKKSMYRVIHLKWQKVLGFYPYMYHLIGVELFLL